MLRMVRSRGTQAQESDAIGLLGLGPIPSDARAWGLCTRVLDPGSNTLGAVCETAHLSILCGIARSGGFPDSQCPWPWAVYGWVFEKQTDKEKQGYDYF